MTPKQVKEIFDKLPSKRRKVLLGFLAGHSREKIMVDADVPSDTALTGHLRELYKNFRIDTGWNDADDRRSGTRKLPLLISLFARCMPELLSDHISEVPNGVEHKEAIAKLSQESVENRTGSGENLMSLASSILDQLGFNQKFQENRTSQYIGYRLNNSEQYQLVLAQRNEDLCVYINKTVLQPELLELKCEHEYFDEDGYDHPVTTTLGCFWVLPSKEYIFLQSMQDFYPDILKGKIVGSFTLNLCDIETTELGDVIPIFNPMSPEQFKLESLGNTNNYIKLNQDKVLPYAWRACISSSEVLREFIGHLGEILMKKQ